MKNDKSNKLPLSLIDKLQQYSAGYLDTSQFGMLVSLLENEFESQPNSGFSEPNLIRILSAVYDKSTFLHEAIRYPHYIGLLTTISSNSNYLTDILVRNPEYFYWIANPSVLNSFPDEESFVSEVNKLISNYKSFNAKLNTLKSLKRRELLRIGARDLTDKPPLEIITSQLSITARSLLSVLFRICYENVLDKYGLHGKKYKYCVISLGKLGGSELNYSSDVDLMVLYEKNLRTGSNKFFEEILTETIQLFAASASSVTDTGYLYRTDFRLRPDGKNSPLCRSLTEYFEYYESRGEDWERQMLIKADFLTGSSSLFNNFIRYILPFIYPLSFNSSPIEKIKSLKENIEKKLQNDDNIKLIAGGIRDIEFTVQALQLISGGRNPGLRTQNTLDAINKLHSSGLLNQEEKSALRNSYIFFRRIEHYLQLMNDTQTHSIPADGELLIKLSSFLGFRNTGEFRIAVNSSRQNVQVIKNSVFGSKTGESGGESLFSQINFVNKSRSLRNYRFISDGTGLIGTKKFDTHTIESFRIIEPVLIKYLKRSSLPDNILENFARIISTVSFPSIWYRQFRSSKFLFSFLKICEYSTLCSDLMIKHEAVREEFITGKLFERIIPEKKNLNELIFTLAFKTIDKKIGPDTVSLMLKRYFFYQIKLYCNEIFCEHDRDYLVAALGSLGTNEMTFKSDLDLIFVSDPVPDTETTRKFIRLLKELKNNFQPFKTDCRLRPEGKSSQLVWNTDSYSDYILHRARTWELQAFCKFNYVAGSKKIFSKLLSSIKQRIINEHPSVIRKDMIEMRRKLYPEGIAPVINLKKGKGGVLDIEFILHYLILINPGLYSRLRGKSKSLAIRYINNLLKSNSAVNLSAEYLRFLRQIILINQIIFDTQGENIPLQSSNRKILAELAGFPDEDYMIKKITLILNNINRIFLKLFQAEI